MLSDRWQTLAEDPRLSDPRVMADIIDTHNTLVCELLVYLGFTFEPVSPDFIAVTRNGRTTMIPQHKAAFPYPPIIQGPGVNKTPAQIADELATYLNQTG